jgi:hypothetical protein
LEIVDSQPMSLPWLGLTEQAGLADMHIHNNDVPMPVGRSFNFSVQFETAKMSQWLSASIDTGQIRARLSYSSRMTCNSKVVLQTRWSARIAE